MVGRSGQDRPPCKRLFNDKPSMNRSNPPRPWVPMTIGSSSELAWSRMQRAGEPASISASVFRRPLCTSSQREVPL